MSRIDLKSFAKRAERAGVDLTIWFEKSGEVALRGQRGENVVWSKIPIRVLNLDYMDQGELFNRSLDAIVKELDRAEKEPIKTGGHGT